MTDRLLENLRRHATPRGLALVSEARLTRELSASRRVIAQGIGDLQREGRIEILSPLPYAVLALKPRPWSSSSTHGVRKVQQSSSSEAPSHIEVPVSSSFAAAATQPEDGGAGEGRALLEEVLAALGPEADRDEFRGILAGRDRDLIRRCLGRVQATKSIRVSRTALFRSLLRKLST